jgi:hypothetical protein
MTRRWKRRHFSIFPRQLFDHVSKYTTTYNVHFCPIFSPSLFSGYPGPGGTAAKLACLFAVAALPFCFNPHVCFLAAAAAAAAHH